MFGCGLPWRSRWSEVVDFGTHEVFRVRSLDATCAEYAFVAPLAHDANPEPVLELSKWLMCEETRHSNRGLRARGVRRTFRMEGCKC
jgi:hypothetical protein